MLSEPWLRTWWSRFSVLSTSHAGLLGAKSTQQVLWVSSPDPGPALLFLGTARPLLWLLEVLCLQVCAGQAGKSTDFFFWLRHCEASCPPRVTCTTRRALFSTGTWSQLLPFLSSFPTPF